MARPADLLARPVTHAISRGQIAFHVRFQVDSSTTRDRVGAALAPPGHKRARGKRRYISLQMSGLWPDCRGTGDQINVRVKVSGPVGQHDSGLFVCC